MAVGRRRFPPPTSTAATRQRPRQARRRATATSFRLSKAGMVPAEQPTLRRHQQQVDGEAEDAGPGRRRQDDGEIAGAGALLGDERADAWAVDRTGDVAGRDIED